MGDIIQATLRILRLFARLNYDICLDAGRNLGNLT
jgi:hypothetical protein